MTVTQLHELMEKIIAEGKGNLRVFSSSDAEGNSFDSLHEYSYQYYVEDEYMVNEDDLDEYDYTDQVEPVVVLWV